MIQQDKVNILVVDDSPSWCAIYQEALADEGHSIRVASDLPTALDCLNQQFFQVAVVDIRLEMNDRENAEGLDVLQRIWELNEGTVAVVSSAHATADMLPTFRTYRVFDFVPRSALSPGDLAQQYKSAAFIKGTIDKAGSLDESMKRIYQAVAEARRNSINNKWLQSPFHFFKGVSSKDMQTRLRGAGMVELRPFLARVCRPLYPWLLDESMAVTVADDADQPIAMEAYAWSRALAKPVIVRVARRGKLEESAQLLPVGGEWKMACAPGALIQHSSEHFEGAAYEIVDLAFEDKFAPPPARRTSQ